MIIQCHDEGQFIETIERLVHKGLGFTADATQLTIKLTGSY